VNRNEVIDLLTAVSASDRRTVGQADVEVWQTAIGHLALPECQRAVVGHIRECPGMWLEPGHILKRVEAERKQLADNAVKEQQAIAYRSLSEYPEGSYVDPDTRGVATEWDSGIGSFRVKTPARPEHRKKCMDEIRAVLGDPRTKFGRTPA